MRFENEMVSFFSLLSNNQKFLTHFFQKAGGARSP
jgi:hypothetical protein